MKSVIAFILALLLAGGAATAQNVQSPLSGSPVAWTPTITCVTPGDLSVAYTTRVGNYVKIGNQVTLTFTLQTSTFTWTTASGSVQITGLPFAANSTAGITFTGSMSVNGWTRASYTQIVPFLTAGSSTLTLNISGSGQGVGNDVIGSFPTAGTVVMEGTITYYTN